MERSVDFIDHYWEFTQDAKAGFNEQLRKTTICYIMPAISKSKNNGCVSRKGKTDRCGPLNFQRPM
jgi:hypothetical protein